jgi:hypothetical protein
MTAQKKIDFSSAKSELVAIAGKSGALESVFVIGGAQPRAGDWQSPNYQHMEVTTTSDRMQTLALKIARTIEDRFSYYAVCVPPGVDRGQQPFMSISMAADLAGCGSRSLAGPVLHPEYGFMYYGAIITTMPLPADKPLDPPACPAPECVEMYAAEGTTPCLATCPAKAGGCLDGRIEDGALPPARPKRAVASTAASRTAGLQTGNTTQSVVQRGCRTTGCPVSSTCLAQPCGSRMPTNKR